MLKNQRGGAAVEFAIVLPLLAIILFGTIDFALLFYNKQVITNASREGARYAIVKDHQNATGFAKAENIMDTYYSIHRLIIDFSNNITVTHDIQPKSAGATYYTATATYDYQHLFGSLDFFGSTFGISTTTTITGKTTMRSE